MVNSRHHGHVVFRYPNRKLYDTITSKYVTLDTLRACVVADDVFAVRDYGSGCDETLAILCQILHHQVKHGADVPMEAVVALIKGADASIKETA